MQRSVFRLSTNWNSRTSHLKTTDMTSLRNFTTYYWRLKTKKVEPLDRRHWVWRSQSHPYRCFFLKAHCRDVMIKVLKYSVWYMWPVQQRWNRCAQSRFVFSFHLWCWIYTSHLHGSLHLLGKTSRLDEYMHWYPSRTRKSMTTNCWISFILCFFPFSDDDPSLLFHKRPFYGDGKWSEREWKTARTAQAK